MIKKGDAVVIQKVGNGWQVMPFQYSNNVIIELVDIFAFQQLRYSKDEACMMDETTLLGWLEKHFE